VYGRTPSDGVVIRFGKIVYRLSRITAPDY